LEALFLVVLIGCLLGLIILLFTQEGELALIIGFLLVGSCEHGANLFIALGALCRALLCCGLCLTLFCVEIFLHLTQ
jgi:hypothetical protein